MPLTIYKRGRFWWLTGDVTTFEGKQRVHESTGETDERAADEIRLNRENEARRDRELGPKARYLFEEAVNAYLDAGKPDRFILPLLDHFRGKRVADMTGEMVRGAARELYPEASYTTWNRQVVTPTKSIINHSADAGRCPTIKIKGFTKRDRSVRRPSTVPRRAVDRSYIDAFRANCRNKRVATMMLMMFQTGARVSDLIHLELRDLDLVRRLVTFRDMKNGEDGEGDLTVELVFELQQIVADLRQRAEADGRDPVNDRVFGYQHRWSIYKEIKATCARAKIPYLATHQPGRHSFFTEMMVRNRVDVKTAATKGRSKSPQLLFTTYAHAEDGPGVIDKVFGKKRKKA